MPTFYKGPESLICEWFVFGELPCHANENKHAPLSCVQILFLSVLPQGTTDNCRFSSLSCSVHMISLRFLIPLHEMIHVSAWDTGKQQNRSWLQPSHSRPMEESGVPTHGKQWRVERVPTPNSPLYFRNHLKTLDLPRRARFRVQKRIGERKKWCMEGKRTYRMTPLINFRTTCDELTYRGDPFRHRSCEGWE